MSLSDIRSFVEVAVTNAYGALTPAVPVIYQNVQEEPPGGADCEYVIVSLSYPQFTEAIICPDESNIETIRGNVTLFCYTPRATGMKRLEELGSVGIRTLNNLKSAADPNGVRFNLGSVEGPIPVLTSDNPLALVNVNAPFTAKG